MPSNRGRYTSLFVEDNVGFRNHELSTEGKFTYDTGLRFWLRKFVVEVLLESRGADGLNNPL